MKSLEPLPALSLTILLECCPLEKSDLIQYHREDEDPDKGQGGVPNDGDHLQHIAPTHHPQSQGSESSKHGTSADLQHFWLPDYQ